jgi:hypothetical protein
MHVGGCYMAGKRCRGGRDRLPHFGEAQGEPARLLQGRAEQ